jgi:hypothetical protein
LPAVPGGADQFAVYLMHDEEGKTLAAHRDDIIPTLLRTSRSFMIRYC